MGSSVLRTLEEAVIVKKDGQSEERTDGDYILSAKPRPIHNEITYLLEKRVQLLQYSYHISLRVLE